MANICSYELMITGNKKENVEKAVDIIYTNFLFTEGAKPSILTPSEGIFCTQCVGWCKWSVVSALVHDAYKTGFPLSRISKECNVIIEVFSEEPGCEFQEHFLFFFGDQVIEETCVEWQEYNLENYDGSTLEEQLDQLNEECETTFSLDDFKGKDYITIGGYKNYLQFVSITLELFEKLEKIKEI